MNLQNPTNPTESFDKDKIETTKQAICLSLSRTAGMKWKQDELVASDADLANIANVLLNYQNKSWISLLTHFGNIINNSLDLPNNNTIWAFHLSGLTESTINFIEKVLSDKTNKTCILSSENLNSLSNLMTNKKRISSLAIEIIVWQRKLCPLFGALDAKTKQKSTSVQKRKAAPTDSTQQSNIKQQKKTQTTQETVTQKPPKKKKTDNVAIAKP